MANPAFQEVLSKIEQFKTTAKDLVDLQQFTVDLIAEKLLNYNWVGFYMLDSNDAEVLVLGPFHGAPTDHIRIPVSEGICGAAVAQQQTVIVDDVSADPRYLSCSIETKSEIVVPIYVQDRVVGEIDIDSHELSAFGPSDRTFLEQCAVLIGDFIEKKQA
jgi:L-methionine (R)-S-oxide reductase